MNKQDRQGVRNPAEVLRRYDQIIESGEKDGWLYIKLKSGIAACWRQKTISSSFTQALGSLFVSDKKLLPIKYPFAFKEKPFEFIEIKNPICQGWHIEETENDEGKTGQYAVVRPIVLQETINITYQVAVIGKYKIANEYKNARG